MSDVTYHSGYYAVVASQTAAEGARHTIPQYVEQS